MPRSTDIKFSCATCGALTRATIATGRLNRHTPPGQSERCEGSRRIVFAPGQPENRLDDTPTPSDYDWYSKKPLTIQPIRLTLNDIQIAQRLLKATSLDPKRYDYMKQPLRAFLDNARAHRPDLFKPKQAMRSVRRNPAPIVAAADPSKTLNKPRTEPTRKVWYREVLVGKRN